MLEAARILAGISLISLISAIAVATSPSGRLQFRQLDGAAATNDRYLQVAAYLLIGAVGLSGAAAILALAAWLG